MNTILAQVQHSLVESESMFRSLFHNNHAVMLVVNPIDGSIVDANPAASSYYGWSRDELLQMNVSNINTMQPNQIYAAMLEAKNRNKNHFEFQHRLADGTIRDVEVYSGPIRINDHDLLYSIVFDITERKQAQKALIHSDELMRYVIEHSNSAIAVFDRDLRYVYVSHRYIKDHKVNTPDIIGKYHYDVFPEIPQKWREVHQRALSGEVLSSEDDHFVRQDGRIEWTRWECRPWYQADGTIGGIILYTEVITDRKNLQAQFAQAQKMESVGRLAGGVAHDYNNILSVIIGYTEMALYETDESEPINDYLKQVLSAAERSRDITRQLLAFARKDSAAPKIVDLNESVESMLKILEKLIGEDIEIIWCPKENLHPVLIDPSQLDQILANLCVNARDAISNIGRLIIETDIKIFDQQYCNSHIDFLQGDFVMLSVSDNGSGMDRETLDKIFDPFFTTKAMGKGTGLGLATVYGIVKQNNGFINVYSEIGSGTTFKIYFPKHLEDKIKESDNNIEKSINKGNGETIFLVEDDGMILTMVERMLLSNNYNVIKFQNPLKAIESAKSRHPDNIDLLITDVIMPEMNGRELSEHLNQIYPNLKTLFISGYTADLISNRGVSDKSGLFLQKPFSSNELAAKVRYALDENSGLD